MCDNALMHHFAMWPQIIRLLQSQGFSQRKLAEKAGVDQSTICRIADGSLPEPRYSAGIALIDLAGGPERLAAEHGIKVADPGSAAPAQEVAHA